MQRLRVRWWGWLLLVLSLGVVLAAGTHELPDQTAQRQIWFGEHLAGHIVSGCAPGTSVTLQTAAFACAGYLRVEDGRLVYASQPSAVLGPLSGGDGRYWVAFHAAVSGVVSGWTRQPGTHYLWKKDTSQPVDPTDGLVVASLTVAGSQITQRSDVRPLGAIGHSLGVINVQDFGADPDNDNDDTSAILAAVATIPGTDATGGDYVTKGAGCLYFPLPRRPGGSYHLSQTLDLTEKWNLCLTAAAPLHRGRGASAAAEQALFTWYGAANQPMILLAQSQGATLNNLAVDCRGVAGTIGVALAPTATQVNSVKYMTLSNLVAKDCDVGIRVGDFSSNGPDISSIVFVNPLVHNNSSAGFQVQSGNAVVVAQGLTAFANGTAPAGGHPGANVALFGGALTLTGYTSAGAGSDKPVGADIYVTAGGLRIYGAWSDTHGDFLVSSGATQGSIISGVRHFEGGMDDTNTPRSILWNSADPLIVDGLFFSNISSASGAGTKIIDHGVRFVLGSPHTSVTPAFTGTTVTTNLGYIGLGVSPGINAGLAVGRPVRTDTGSWPAITAWGKGARPAIVLSSDSPDGASTLALNGANGALIYGMNLYGDGTDFRAIKAGPVALLTVQAGTTPGSSPGLTLTYDTDATTPGEVRMASPTTLFTIVLRDDGTALRPTLALDGHAMHWGATAPTGGTCAVGDVTWNSSAASGQPPFWLCTVAGSPGTWSPMSNLP